MRITHQSTADAVAMHARFNVMNLKVIQKRLELSSNDFTPTVELLVQHSSRGIGYHQGCYCLGLLSLNDVPSTLLRMLTVLESLQEISLNQLIDDEHQPLSILTTNVHFVFLDTFEKQGLIDTILAYKKSGIAEITAGHIKELICSHLNVPQPGARTDLSLPIPNSGFTFDYERLIVNRDPTFDGSSTIIQPYEYYASTIPPALYQDLETKSIPEVKQFIQHAFELYLGPQKKSPHFLSRSRTKKYHEEINIFLNRLSSVETYALTHNKDIEWLKTRIKKDLGIFYQRTFPPADETTRNEGHLHTLLVIVAGLIDNVGGFRTQFSEKYQILHSPTPGSSSRYFSN
jgi:hypothetical protein